MLHKWKLIRLVTSNMLVGAAPKWWRPELAAANVALYPSASCRCSLLFVYCSEVEASARLV